MISKNTNRKKYGADCPMKNPEIARKAQKNKKKMNSFYVSVAWQMLEKLVLNCVVI